MVSHRPKLDAFASAAVQSLPEDWAALDRSDDSAAGLRVGTCLMMVEAKLWCACRDHCGQLVVGEPGDQPPAESVTAEELLGEGGCSEERVQGAPDSRVERGIVCVHGAIPDEGCCIGGHIWPHRGIPDVAARYSMNICELELIQSTRWFDECCKSFDRISRGELDEGDLAG